MVIAIIAILAAMLLPALTKARKKAQQAVCMSNLKQMTMVNIMYASDNHGRLMRRDTDPRYGTGGAAKQEWMDSVMNYYSLAANMIICPSAAAPIKNPTAYGLGVVGSIGPGGGAGGQPGGANNAYVVFLGINSPMGWDITCSYTANSWLYSDIINGVEQGVGWDTPRVSNANGVGAPSWAWVFFRENQISQPSLTPTYADGTWQDSCPVENDVPSSLTFGPDWLNLHEGYEMGRVCIARHGKNDRTLGSAVNVALYDGHVELSKLPHLWSYYWHRNWRPAAVRVPTTAPP